jgi:hypothetical protein
LPMPTADGTRVSAGEKSMRPRRITSRPRADAASIRISSPPEVLLGDQRWARKSAGTTAFLAPPWPAGLRSLVFQDAGVVHGHIPAEDPARPAPPGATACALSTGFDPAFRHAMLLLRTFWLGGSPSNRSNYKISVRSTARTTASRSSWSTAPPKWRPLSRLFHGHRDRPGVNRRAATVCRCAGLMITLFPARDRTAIQSHRCGRRRWPPPVPAGEPRSRT